MIQRSPAVVLADRGREANEPPACRTQQHVIGITRRGGTSGILRIASAQLRAIYTARSWCGNGRRVLRDGWGAGLLQWYGPSVVFPGRVAEWQTRWLQVPVSFGTWGFKSPFAHRSV